MPIHPEGGEAAPDGVDDPVDDPLDDDFDAEAYEGADYTKALAMWKEILVRFPQYRQTDGVLYLLAYYLKQTLRERESLQIALGLVCKNKYKPLDPPTIIPTDEAVRLSLAPEARRNFVKSLRWLRARGHQLGDRRGHMGPNRWRHPLQHCW